MYIEQIIWYFLIYAMIGYVVEVIYCSFGERKLVNRGFLYGPWLPIYGIGALLVIGATEAVVSMPPLLFLVTVILTSVVEYIGSWALERLFGIQLWDYSSHRFNINGRVCLKNSTLFGLLGLALVYLIHPQVKGAIALMDRPYVAIGSHLILVALGVDTTASTLGMLSFTRLLDRYHRRKEEIERRLASLALESHARLLIERLHEERSELHERLLARSRSLMARFPSASSHNEKRRTHLSELRTRLKDALRETGDE